jgi:hypothetical protein
MSGLLHGGAFGFADGGGSGNVGAGARRQTEPAEAELRRILGRSHPFTGMAFRQTPILPIRSAEQRLQKVR